MKHKHPSIYLSNLGLISSFLLTCLFSVSKCFSSFISWYFPRDLSALLGNSSPKTFSLLTHNQYILTSYTGGWLAWKTIVLFWEFPGGLVVRIPAFHCHAQVQSLNPWLQERYELKQWRFKKPVNFNKKHPVTKYSLSPGLLNTCFLSNLFWSYLTQPQLLQPLIFMLSN